MCPVLILSAIPLNFKVSPEFRCEFKIEAGPRDLQMNELVQLAFKALTEKVQNRKERSRYKTLGYLRLEAP